MPDGTVQYQCKQKQGYAVISSRLHEPWDPQNEISETTEKLQDNHKQDESK